MRKAVLLGGLSLLLSLSPAGATGLSIGGMLRAEMGLSYAGTKRLIGQTKFLFQHGPGGKNRIEYLSPPQLKGELVIDNGQARWHFSPRDGQLDISPSEASLRAPAFFERLLRANYRPVFGKDSVIAGRKVRCLDLLPIRSGRFRQRLWLDLATQLPLRVERRDQKGKLLDFSEFTAIDFLPKPRDEAFDLVLPSLARPTTVVDRVDYGKSLSEVRDSIDFPAELPAILPSGYEVLDVQVFDAKKVRSLHWRLTDGMNTLSLFVTSSRHRTPPPREAKVFDLGPSDAFFASRNNANMLTWATPANSYTLIGLLPRAEMKLVALSTFAKKD
ncbi:MAG TPA: sigma-E factor regulatory protein RseB domain-containing protein [Chroococcales cyanobacterium]